MGWCRQYPKSPKIERSDSLTGASFRKASDRAAAQQNGHTNGHTNGYANTNGRDQNRDAKQDVEMGHTTPEVCLSLIRTCVNLLPKCVKACV